MNDSIATKDIKGVQNEARRSEYSQIERISSIYKKSIVNTNESEKCPFRLNNRSPDSFVRISVNGKDEEKPSEKTSHISLKSSII